MDATYREILQRGSSHDDYIMGLFNNLLASTNTIFTDYIQHEKDRWENGTDIHPDVLISEAITKYNNMVAKMKWNQIEPTNTKITVLSTQPNNLQEKFFCHTSTEGRKK